MAITLSNSASNYAISRNLEKSQNQLELSQERLASGRRINHAYEDPVGLSLSASLKGKIASLDQVQRNIQDAISLMQVAEGGVNEMDNITTRLRELAMQSSSDTVSDDERELLEIELQQLKTEMDRFSQNTKFLGVPLLNGNSRMLQFQVGIENTEADRLTYDTGQADLTLGNLGLGGISILDRDSALDSLSVIDEAQKKIQHPRATLGAFQHRLQSLASHQLTYAQNLAAANSRIEDTDYAKEMANYTRQAVLNKVGVAVAAQANQSPLLALRLLHGID